MASTYLAGEQTKRNILRESKKLFYKKGYTDTTYTDISAVTKMNRALIPYHFKNKQILGMEIYQDITNEFYHFLDNTFDATQFDSDFINVMHLVAYYRFLADNQPLLRFVSELQTDETIILFDDEVESQWLTGLGSKFGNMTSEQLSLLCTMHTGMKKEMIHTLASPENKASADTITTMHIHMLMRYAGYSAKKIDELLDAAFEVANLVTFRVKNGFSVEIKYS